MKKVLRKGVLTAASTSAPTATASLSALLARAKALTGGMTAQLAATTTAPARSANPYWSQRAAVASTSRKSGEHHRVASRTK